MRPEYDLVPPQPGPGFGDSIGAMTIAGGIMGALFHRERSGKPSVVDISLLGTGLWAMGQTMALSLLANEPWGPPPAEELSRNPLVGNYRTKDGRYVALCCLQAGQYWPPLCEIIGRPELVTDERFVDHPTLLAHTKDAVAILTDVFARATAHEWRDRLEPFVGQWTIVQHTLEAAADPQTAANGYLQECRTAGGTPFTLVAAPVQYDEEPATPRRAPQFNEHGDDILAELGIDWDTVADLKVRGVVA
jgi:crotonobetainyl-CoA:carnitine CoA-transferase CaiB-like acyl-CoA transferase